MKKVLFLISFIALLSSCNTTSIYTTDPCNISIHIESGTPTASYVLANFRPEDNQVYYIAGIVTLERFSSVKNDTRFMQMCIDYEYKEYINWRYDLLEEEEEHIATFSSHCLSYGEDSRYFRDLSPNTTYVLYAFCVDPDILKPTGNLFHIPFTTSELRQSNLTFQVMFKEREDDIHVTIMPSNDNEHYVWNWEDISYLEEYRLTVDTYIKSFISSVKDYDLGEYLYVKGAQTYKCTEGDIEEGHKYVVMAAGFDGDITTKVFSTEFEYPFLTEDPIDLK